MSYKKKYRFIRKFSFVFLFFMLFQVLEPTMAYALTSGPSQPEVQSFEPFGTSEMVDLFSGDFTYNIPLFELPGPNGGYPFNLAYHSGIGMDQEASWVGLGWSLNPGAINRTMRGLPDDFNGDEIRQELDMKENITVGGSVGFNVEIAGFPMGGRSNVTITNNSYRGIGVGFTQGVSFSITNSSGTSIGGIGLDMTLNNQEGASLSPSLSLTASTTKDKNNIQGSLGLNASFNFNSRRGLTNFTIGASAGVKQKPGSKHNTKRKSLSSGVNSSTSISFANVSYSPTIGNPMEGKNVSIGFSAGGDLGTVYLNGSVSGFWSKEYLKYPDQNIPSYGYLNLANAKEIARDEKKRPIIDVNREKDIVIRQEIPNLAIPSLTYDVYSILGQGVGGMYRPYRNDIGLLYEQYNYSEKEGGGLGGEVGIGYPTHGGISLDLNYSENEGGKWDNSNELKDKYDFESQSIGQLYENVFFKRAGEHSSEKIDRFKNAVGGSKVVTLKFPEGGNSVNNESWFRENKAKISAKYKDKQGQDVHINSNVENKKLNRRKRNLSILPLKNEEIEGIGEFKNIYYYSNFGNYNAKPNSPLNRNSINGKSIKHHIGGVMVYNANGSRYIYGLPAYNKVQKDVSFSVDGRTLQNDCGPLIDINDSNGSEKPKYKFNDLNTDEYYSRKTTPAFTHSHLLTSILGSDYVDLTNDGPTNDDLGYWVKFNYVKAENNFKWRAPYWGANHVESFRTMNSDDKGTFIYGEKETWYLATAETKTHIAIFEIDKRADGKGALKELAKFNTGVGSASSYKLNKIKLYSKKEYLNNSSNAIPIKTINFDYDYSLCPNVFNNSGIQVQNNEGAQINTKKGKLTLKKIWFENGTSKRGRLSPYKFDYGNIADPINNPPYSTHAYDRWGSYKPLYANVCDNLDFPYTEQYTNTTLNFKDQTSKTDLYAKAWNLKKIILPSGGEIEVDYEADDYAYVQNKLAMQMFKVEKLGGVSTELYSPETGNKGNTNDEERKVYFTLLEPIVRDGTELNKLKEYFDYRENGKSFVYYKTLMTLRKGPDGHAFKEYITGYAEVKDYGFDPVNDKQAWVMLKAKEDKGINYHPFTYNGLHFMKSNLPNLAYNAGLTEHSLDQSTGAAQAMRDMCGSIVELFTDYYKSRTTSNSSYCRYIDFEHTWLRLNSVTKAKKGGGSRVSTIKIKDNWASLSNNNNPNAEYGQAYSYKIEEKGRPISSGVATYEPIIGGDENALRYHKEYSEKVMWRGSNSYLIEFPINESYYPAPSVGYRKVTVSSLNTDKLLKTGNPTIGDDYGISSSGITENEFYTAKEFPILTDETSLTNSSKNKHQAHRHQFYVFGTTIIDKYAGTQGYYLELNDMHGKPKKVANYALDKDGKKESTPYSWVKYNYFNKEVRDIKGKLKHYQVVNELPVLLSDVDPNNQDKALVENANIGIDYEMFTDMRAAYSKSTNGGGKANLEIFYVPFPLPIGFPMINIGKNIVESYISVTNKIVHRSGILKETVAYNDGATIKTENIYFDHLTGKPLLTRVNNSYDKPIYNYSIPARWKYPDMGASYKNLGLKVKAKIVQPQGFPLNKYLISTMHGHGVEHLSIGDELICLENNRKVYVENVSGTTVTLTLDGNYAENNSGIKDIKVLNTANSLGAGYATSIAAINSNTTERTFLVTRSHKRNLLDNTVANIVSLANPTQNRIWQECRDTIHMKIPRGDSTLISYCYPDTLIQCHKTDDSCFYKKIELINFYLSKKSLIGSIGYYSFLTGGISILNDLYWNACRSGSIDTSVIQQNQYHYVFKGNHFLESINKYSLEVIPPFCSYYDENNILVSNGGANNCLARSMFANENITYSNLDSIQIDYELPDTIYNNPNCANSIGYVNEYKLTLYVNRGSYQDTYILMIDPEGVPHEDKLCFNYVKVEYKEPIYTTTPIILTDRNYILDSILQAQVSTYKDNWEYNYEELRIKNLTRCQNSESTPSPNYDLSLNDLNDLNDFAKGYKGIWRLKDNYTYYTERKGIAHNQQNDSQLESDGIFGMTMFKWGSIVGNQCAPGWTLVNEVTKYNSNSSETETRDALDLYSAVLYGHEGTLPIAVAKNAKYEAIGYESFEEVVNGDNQYEAETNNLSFYTNYLGETCGSIDYFIEYDLTFPFVVTGEINPSVAFSPSLGILKEADALNYCASSNGPISRISASMFDKISAQGLNSSTLNYNAVDGPMRLNIEHISFINDDDSINPAWCHLFSGAYSATSYIYNPSFNGNIIDIGPIPQIIPQSAFRNFLPNDPDRRSAYNGLYRVFGNVTFPQRHYFDIPANSISNNLNVSFVETEAHTGKKSMKITENVSFPQHNLTIEENKKYVFSAWIKTTENNVFSYQDNNYIDIVSANNSNNNLESINIQPVGKIINGWQKIEGEIVGNGGRINIKFNKSGSYYFIDDIRIHPVASTLQTYVYDAQNYKLRAILDNNNYATLYYYDDGGNLYLIKKETEKGIATIQESKTNIK